MMIVLTILAAASAANTTHDGSFSPTANLTLMATHQICAEIHRLGGGCAVFGDLCPEICGSNNTGALNSAMKDKSHGSEDIHAVTATAPNVHVDRWAGKITKFKFIDPFHVDVLPGSFQRHQLQALRALGAARWQWRSLAEEEEQCINAADQDFPAYLDERFCARLISVLGLDFACEKFLCELSPTYCPVHNYNVITASSVRDISTSHVY